MESWVYTPAQKILVTLLRGSKHKLRAVMPSRVLLPSTTNHGVTSTWAQISLIAFRLGLESEAKDKNLIQAS